METKAEQILMGLLYGSVMELLFIQQMRDCALAIEIPLFFQVLYLVYFFSPVIFIYSMLELNMMYSKGFTKLILKIVFLGLIVLFCEVVNHFFNNIFPRPILWLIPFSLSFLAFPLIKFLIAAGLQKKECSGTYYHGVFILSSIIYFCLGNWLVGYYYNLIE